MRLILPLATLFLLAACGTTPPPVATATRPVMEPPHERGDLIGLDANALATRFGRPQFQVREGDGTKLQFAGGGCILDAYLYPATSGGGVARVTHIDTRTRDGRSTDQAGCIAMIERR